MFSVTGGQILDALATNGSDPDAVSSSAYYSIFLRPVLDDPFSFVSETSPNANSPTRAWEASTITDYANVIGGPAAFYAKGESQASVAVLSRAMVNGRNIYLGYSYEDGGHWPIDWGGFGTINEILPESSLFQFVIQTNATLSGSYTISGIASALVSESSQSASGAKPFPDTTFELTATPLLVVPEPASCAGALLGLGVLGLLRRYCQRSDRD